MITIDGSYRVITNISREVNLTLQCRLDSNPHLT